MLIILLSVEWAQNAPSRALCLLFGARGVRARRARAGRYNAAALRVAETAREMLVGGAQLLVEREPHAPQLLVQRRLHPLAQLARHLWRRRVQRLH